MKNIYSLSVFFLFQSFLLGAQNLVPNWDFEDTTHCYADNSIIQAKDWYSPTSGTPDYYYLNNSPNSGCPSNNFFGTWQGWDFSSNPFGYQLPFSGFGFAGILVKSDNAFEYMSIQLTDTLRAGKKYCVEAYVSLSENSPAGLDLIQFNFNQSRLIDYDSINGNYLYFNLHGDAGNQLGNIIMDTLNWTLISDTLIAQGGERYLTIGNFDTAQTNYHFKDSLVDMTKASYYYFDNVSVFYCDTPEIVNNPILPNQIALLFPNPSDGKFQLNVNYSSQSEFHLYDLRGREVINPLFIPSGNQTIPLNLSLVEGIYLYKLISDKVIISSNKLVIVR